MSTCRHLDRLNSISGLKAICMFMIFWWHCPIVGLPTPSVDLGGRACELLFVSSGFLTMYNHYNSSSDYSFNGFSIIKNKLIKLYPLYFLSLCYGFILTIYISKDFSSSTIINAVLDAVFVQPWTLTGKSFNGPGWFLGCLLFCYFISPLLIKLTNKLKCGLSFVILSMIMLFIEFITIHYSDTVFYLSIHSNPFVCSLKFFLGMISCKFFLKILSKEIEISKFLFTLIELLALLLFVLIIIFGKDYLYRGVYAILDCLLIIVISFEKGFVSKALSNRAFLWFSSIQFEFYLMHMLVLDTMKAFCKELKIEVVPIIAALISFALCLFAAWIYKRFISSKINAVMKRVLDFIQRLLTDKSTV